MTRPVPPPLLVLASITSVQFGGALAATLIPLVGVAGSVMLRLVVAGALLTLVARPHLRGHSRRAWTDVILFGVSLAVMNGTFYASLGRLPIGVAVTVEFTGPLVLAAALTRTARDLVSVAVAAVGVALISGVGRTPLADLDLVGLALALTAGTAWAAYIVLSARAGAGFPGLDGLAIAMVVGAALVTPLGLIGAGPELLGPEVLWRGVGIAVLSSVLPYSLELVALRHMDARVFGVLLSLEPGVAALAGLLVLGQHLSALQLTGLAAVVLASAAATHGDAATTPAGDEPNGT